jgi:hypothetical protein
LATLDALQDARYLDFSGIEMLSGDKRVSTIKILERGRRAVGLWPDDARLTPSWTS